MIFTGKGDDGTTGLLGAGRVPKYDLRIEPLGTLDEATAAVGLARSLTTDPLQQNDLLEIQRQLYKVMAEVAATPENAARFSTINPDSVRVLESQIVKLTETEEIPQEFILPGDTPAGAALSMARAVVRRAERRVVELADRGQIQNRVLIVYLNRLSTLLFVYEIKTVRAAGKSGLTLAKEG
jgi:cob(I)alamin adenosyltransferase